VSLSRKLIRRGVAELLTGATIAGDRVQPHKPAKAWEEDGPGLYVWTRREVVTNYTDAPREYRRELELVVEAHASRTSSDEAEDLVDDVLAEVELILERNRHLPTLPDSVSVIPDDSGLEEVELESSGQARTYIAAGGIVWRVVYTTKAPPLETIADTFRDVRARGDFAPEIDGLLEAIDVVPVTA